LHLLTLGGFSTQPFFFIYLRQFRKSVIPHWVIFLHYYSLSRENIQKGFPVCFYTYFLGPRKWRLVFWVVHVHFKELEISFTRRVWESLVWFSQNLISRAICSCSISLTGIMRFCYSCMIPWVFILCTYKYPCVIQHIYHLPIIRQEYRVCKNSSFFGNYFYFWENIWRWLGRSRKFFWMI
jgi:hypothetical protein